MRGLAPPEVGLHPDKASPTNAATVSVKDAGFDPNSATFAYAMRGAVFWRFYGPDTMQ